MDSSSSSSTNLDYFDDMWKLQSTATLLSLSEVCCFSLHTLQSFPFCYVSFPREPAREADDFSIRKAVVNLPIQASSPLPIPASNS
ncbi:hypothetical protein ACFX19_022237 [Malus domestica]